MPHRIPKARALMCSALELMDSSDAAADIGAHLDLAIHRLDEDIRTAMLGATPGTRIEILKPNSPTHMWRRDRRPVRHGSN